MQIPKLWLCQNCETLQPITQLTCEVCGEGIPTEYLLSSFDINNEGEEYPFVDLGLSVMWAKYNLGAMKETEHGDYFTWNDIHDNSLFTVCSTEICKIDIFNYYKNQEVLLSSRFSDIRMPSIQDFKDLIRNCQWEQTAIDGINGYKVIGKNGNHIFLPISGQIENNMDVTSINCYGQYLSGSYKNDNVDHYLLLRFMQNEHYIYTFSNGLTTARTIRPVIDRDCYKHIYISKALESIAKSEFVDLGLSVKWALCNLGAKKPEDFGDYYSWGGLSPQTDSSYMNKSIYVLQQEEVVDNTNCLTPQNDIATQLLGEGCRIPTSQEIDEIRIKCKWEWIRVNNVWGCQCTGPNGNKLFLPAAGSFSHDKLEGVVDFGRYWSSKAFSNDNHAYGLGFRKNDGITYTFGICNRNNYLPIRPVKDC